MQSTAAALQHEPARCRHVKSGRTPLRQHSERLPQPCAKCHLASKAGHNAAPLRRVAGAAAMPPHPQAAGQGASSAIDPIVSPAGAAAGRAGAM